VEEKRGCGCKKNGKGEKDWKHKGLSVTRRNKKKKGISKTKHPTGDVKGFWVDQKHQQPEKKTVRKKKNHNNHQVTAQNTRWTNGTRTKKRKEILSHPNNQKETGQG